MFVRLSNCNLKCDFCDTKYSWKEGKEVSIVYILLEIVSYNCKNIVFTGGEPLLQQDELIELMEKLLSTNLSFHFEIETNGTIAPKKRLAELTDLFTVSPKYNFKQKKFNYSDIFSHIEELTERPNLVFKFVVATPEDIIPIDKFLQNFNKSGHEVFIMPEATTAEMHNLRLQMLFVLAKKYKLRISPRLQILAFGNKRGV